jgi:nitrogen regulatory protein P-II 1
VQWSDLILLSNNIAWIGERKEVRMKKVTAIVRTSILKTVEDRLLDEGVMGITVTPVKGFGEFKNFFRKDIFVDHIKIEVFTFNKDAHRVAEVIMESAHSGCAGDGLVAILPVEQIYKIRTKKDVETGSLCCKSEHAE